MSVPAWIKQIRDKDNKVIEDINSFPEELRLRELPFEKTKKEERNELSR